MHSAQAEARLPLPVAAPYQGAQKDASRTVSLMLQPESPPPGFPPFQDQKVL